MATACIGSSTRQPALLADLHADVVLDRDRVDLEIDVLVAVVVVRAVLRGRDHGGVGDEINRRAVGAPVLDVKPVLGAMRER
jgi:hypothetical protein